MSELIMLVGLVASGKSTYSNYLQKHNYKVHSSDMLRKELFGDETYQDKNEELFAELHRRIIRDLELGNNVVYDATNINYKKRMYFLNMIKHIQCKKTCVVMATPIEVCVENNLNRYRVVPTNALIKMYKNFVFPSYFEGWDSIIIHYDNAYPEYTFESFYNNYKDYNQYNPHHTLSLYEHCYQTYKYLLDNKAKPSLVLAGYLHDCGKPMVRTFADLKGNESSVAHYYNHNNVSAYEAMFYLFTEKCNMSDIVYACSLIQWHMQPYFMKTEKSIKKWKEKFGEGFYKDLMLLHEADENAHAPLTDDNFCGMINISNANCQL